MARLPQARIRPTTSRILGPDLTREFERTIDDWGYHVLYLRRDTNVHCECWNYVTNQPQGFQECRLCYGTGYRVQIERHFSRHFSESTPGRLTNSHTPAEPGLVDTSIKGMFLKPVVRPRVKDIIFRVEWHQSTELVSNLIEILEIKDVNDLRQEQGLLSFYKAYCDTISINKPLFEGELRRETGIMIVD